MNNHDYAFFLCVFSLVTLYKTEKKEKLQNTNVLFEQLLKAVMSSLKMSIVCFRQMGILDFFEMINIL